MPDINGKFIKPLISLYGELGTDDMDLVLSVYEKTLSGFSDAVLDGGFRIVAGSYFPSKRNPWPAPAICKRACEKVISEKQSAAPRAPEKPRYPEWSEEAIRTADGLVHSELGREAAREGWVLGLHDFCRDHRRLPNRHEIPKIQAGSDFITRFAASADGLGYATMPLAKLANSMLAKREALAKRVLGETA